MAKRFGADIDMTDVQKLKDLSADDLLRELRAREAKTTPTPRAAPPETRPDLREFDDAAIAGALKANQKVIYGTDDRVDVFHLPAGPNRDDVDSVVALFDPTTEMALRHSKPRTSVRRKTCAPENGSGISQSAHSVPASLSHPIS
jgi:hypothetical protein